MLVLVFMCIVCVLVWLQTPDPDFFEDAPMCPVYVINLKKHTDRLRIFQEKYDTSDARAHLGKACRFPAVEGDAVDWLDVVSPDRLEALQRVATTGKRMTHHELTPGAVGCYMSHIGAWKKLVASNRPFALIFEDDADVPPDMFAKLSQCMKEIPENWDLFLLGWEGSGDSTAVGKHITKMKRFLRGHAYMISQKCARTLLPTMLPMTQQVDWAMSAHIPRINVFGATDQIVPVNWQGTSIQTPLVTTL